MKKSNFYKLIFSLILILFCTEFLGCFDSPAVNNSISIPNCLTNEKEILDTPREPNTPNLGESVGIESGIRSLSWNYYGDVLYFELERCQCPDFSIYIERFDIYGNSFQPDQRKTPYYYRVRAVLEMGKTKWSNVYKY